jgi:predicted  nucleic acid-binding Zn-ribbon protein
MENGFELLEEKVRRAAELVKELRGENRRLQEEVQRHQGRLAEAERRMEGGERHRPADQAGKLDALKQEIQTLRQEREEVRRRIARLVEVLEGLEGPSAAL